MMPAARVVDPDSVILNRVRITGLGHHWARDPCGDLIGHTPGLGRSAIDEAKREGIMVLSVSVGLSYGFNVLGLGRFLDADPDDFDSYLPGQFWADRFFSGHSALERTLLAPMDSRAFASCHGSTDYEYQAQGGVSWVVPWVAGIYALAKGVTPDLTPELFAEAAFESGRTIQVERDGVSYSLGTVIDPIALIEAVRP